MNDVIITVAGETCPSIVPDEVAALHSRLIRSDIGARAAAFASQSPNAGPRLLSFRRKAGNEYQATYYDYANDEAVHVHGYMNSDELTYAYASTQQPLPTEEEFNAAIDLLRQDPHLGPAVNAGQLQLYRPMPPISYEPSPTGRIPRVLMVGLQPVEGSGLDAEIIGVRMATGEIVRFPSRAPRGASIADTGECGPTGVEVEGTPELCELYHVVISSANGQTLWSFDIIPGRHSSGSSKQSGLELRDVAYRGVSVLRQAHAPILNVRYQDDKDGPYRDWLWQEHSFAAVGTERAPGFIECTKPPETIVEAGADTGDFRGIAMYRTDKEVVFVSEFQAGWYRYKSEWRFHDDGILQPRFGFTSTRSIASCIPRDHHVYWRFDIAIRTAENNRVREFNDPSLPGLASPHVIEFETKRKRDASSQRHWLIENTKTGEGYLFVPGADDGQADDEFGVGDFWILRAKDDEIADGEVDVWGSPSEIMAHIDRFVDSRLPVDDHDIVVWYAGHYNQHIPNLPLSRHIVGPDLRPVKWVEMAENEFRVQELQPGDVRLVHFRGQPVAVYNIGGQFYATQAKCTHAGGPLSQGTLAEKIITCPWHGAKFDVTTGQVQHGPANQPLQIFRVVVTGETGRIEHE